MRDDVVVDGAGLDDAGPADDLRHTVAAFPGRALLAMERRNAAVRPGKRFCPVIGRVNDDRVVRDAELFQLRKCATYCVVVLHHAVGVQANARAAL